MEHKNDTPEQYRTLQHWSVSRRDLERKDQQREQHIKFNQQQVNSNQNEFNKNVNISNNPSMVDALNQVRNGEHKDVSNNEEMMRFTGARMYVKQT